MTFKVQYGQQILNTEKAWACPRLRERLSQDPRWRRCLDDEESFEVLLYSLLRGLSPIFKRVFHEPGTGILLHGEAATESSFPVRIIAPAAVRNSKETVASARRLLPPGLGYCSFAALAV
jgi:hypothetical protein